MSTIKKSGEGIKGLRILPVGMAYKLVGYMNHQCNWVKPPSDMTIETFEDGYVIQRGDFIICSMEFKGIKTTVKLQIVIG